LGLPDTIKPDENKGNVEASDDSLDNENNGHALMTVRELAEFKRNFIMYIIERID
jgi:hypothetical protein